MDNSNEIKYESHEKYGVCSPNLKSVYTRGERRSCSDLKVVCEHCTVLLDSRKLPVTKE